MQASKEAHFEALAAAAGSRGEQTARLAAAAYRGQLLDAHDDAVRAFADAMKTLAASDPEAHRTLLALMVRLNDGIGGPQPR